MKTGVVLLAAGSGKRFGRGRPKQFAPFMGEPLFMYSLKTFLRVPSVREIIVVGSEPFLSAIRRRVRRVPSRVSVSVVSGGPHRGASVRNGVLALSSRIQIVLIHDAARPLVTPAAIRRVEAAAQKNEVALAAWPLADTLKQGDKHKTVRKTIPRENLWLAQTPQGFTRAAALKCLLDPDPKATDDVELAQNKGFKVKLVEGSRSNIKVTYPYDIELCRALAS